MIGEIGVCVAAGERIRRFRSIESATAELASNRESISRIEQRYGHTGGMRNHINKFLESGQRK